MKQLDVETLLASALEAGATDILLAPSAEWGRLILRSGAMTLATVTLPLDTLNAISHQIAQHAGLQLADQADEAKLASFAAPGAQVRLTAVSAPSGPSLRIRLQPTGLLDKARKAFFEGRYGALQVLRWLELARAGTFFIVGLPSSGKTAALHHLLHHLVALKRRVVVHSEAGEFPLPSGVRRAAKTPPPGVLVLDEMDETRKLAYAVARGRQQLVIATHMAPHVAAAFQRVRGVTQDFPDAKILGFLRVGWESHITERQMATTLDLAPLDLSRVRSPVYRWFALGDPATTCAVCHVATIEELCPSCHTHTLDAGLLHRLDDFKAFQSIMALDT